MPPNFAVRSRCTWQTVSHIKMTVEDESEIARHRIFILTRRTVRACLKSRAEWSLFKVFKWKTWLQWGSSALIKLNALGHDILEVLVKNKTFFCVLAVIALAGGAWAYGVPAWTSGFVKTASGIISSTGNYISATAKFVGDYTEWGLGSVGISSTIAGFLGAAVFATVRAKLVTFVTLTFKAVIETILSKTVGVRSTSKALTPGSDKEPDNSSSASSKIAYRLSDTFCLLLSYMLRPTPSENTSQA